MPSDRVSEIQLKSISHLKNPFTCSLA